MNTSTCAGVCVCSRTFSQSANSHTGALYDTDPIYIPLCSKAAVSVRKDRNVLLSYLEAVRVSLVKIPLQV